MGRRGAVGLGAFHPISMSRCHTALGSFLEDSRPSPQQPQESARDHFWRKKVHPSIHPPIPVRAPLPASSRQPSMHAVSLADKSQLPPGFAGATPPGPASSLPLGRASWQSLSTWGPQDSQDGTTPTFAGNVREWASPTLDWRLPRHTFRQNAPHPPWANSG